MIPKIIHYCWFGGNPLPESVTKFIASWRKFLPDYEIKEWNEDNFDLHCCKYVWEAYQAKKYAFVSDYARLYALYTEGGIYLDTDVEVRKSFNPLLENKSFVGWEDNFIGTGILASMKKQQWVKDVLDTYAKESFISWSGKLNNLPNPYRLNKILHNYGLKNNHTYDVLQDDIAVYPIEILCANNHEKNQYVITEDTVSIHHYSGTWDSKNKIGILEKLIDRIKNVELKLSLLI
ncbi:MAG: glycosyltransferase [Prevotella sp.]|nr:glycosyltransferase [Prevotella sp.]